MGKLRTQVRLMNLYGWEDSLAENEIGFLDQYLTLFKVSNGVPRAQIDIVRAEDPDRLRNWLFWGDVDIIHLASHGTHRSIKLGPGHLTVTEFRRWVKEEDEAPLNGAVVLNTSCAMASEAWCKAFLSAGAGAYIAPKKYVWAKDAAIFAAAFYSAYFGSIHKGSNDIQRAYDSYRVAHAAYRSFVPSAANAAKFYWSSNHKVDGRRHLPRIELDG